jgi:esterase/lipase superfamily enzyme
LSGIFAVFSQNTNEVVIVCTYDYHQALETGKTVASDNDSLIRYLVVTSDGFQEKSGFSTALKMAFTTKKNVLVYVHGDEAPLDALTKRGRDLADLFDVNVILFAWPSNKVNNTIENYRISSRNTELCFKRFVQLTDSIWNYVNDEKVEISVFFHSLGNKYAENYAEYLISNENLKSPFSNIILNAACVHAHNHFVWVDELSNRIQNKIFIVFNGKDKVLNMASLFVEGSLLLGRNPGDKRASMATYLDFTDALIEDHEDDNPNRYPKSHDYFYSEYLAECPNLKAVYHYLFNSKIPEFNNTDIFQKTSSGYSVKK